MSSRSTGNAIYYMACALSCIVTIFLTSRFSFTWVTNADSANSPIMWNEFLQYGFSAFKHWGPTFDNWYFTVYPINFLLFYIFNDSGFVPLMLSSAIFIIIICLCAAKIADHISGRFSAFIVLLSVTFISPDLYYNYYSHPFSHNSTNAFGLAILAIYIITNSSKSILAAVSIFILAVLAGASDPWILPSFTIPILLAEIVNFYYNRSRSTYLIFILLAFIVSFFNVIQNIFGLPIGGFTITNAAQMLSNVHYAILLTAKMLPLWVNPSELISYIVFSVWVVVFFLGAVTCVRRGGLFRIFSICCMLSVCGIYSSSVIGDQFPHQRFYVNIAPVVLLLLSVCSRFSKLYFIPVIVSLAISAFNYSMSPLKYENTKKPVYDYMNFLANNKLNYGYGSFWYSMNMAVNWLSNDQIHITPVFFNPDTGAVYFKPVRLQTLTTWHTKEFINGKPQRQFIAITQGQTGGDTCPQVQICIDGAQNQLGKADEILTYNNSTFLVYNRPIVTDIE